MAKEKEVILKVKVEGADGSVKEVTKVAKSLDDYREAVRQAEEEMNKADFGSDAFKKASQTLKDYKGELENAEQSQMSFTERLAEAPGLVGTVGKSIQGLGSAFKALAANPLLAALTLIIGALTAVFKAFTSTKEGAETLQRITAGLGAAFDVLRDLIVKVSKPLLKLFTDPKQALIDFGNLIKDQIVNRIVGILELIPNLAKALGQVFSGDFSGAAKTAGDAVLKVTTGVEDATTKIAAAYGELSEAAREAAREAQEAARLTGVLQDIADKERDLKVARAEQNKELEKTKLQVEDTNLSLEDRIAALDKITAAENDQLEQELQLERQRLAALEALAALSDSDAETLDQLAEQRIRLAQLEQESFAKQTSVATKRISLINQEKAEREAAAAAYQKIEDDIQKRREENILASIEDERERSLKTLEFQRAADLKAINELEATEDQKARLRLEAEEKYQREVAAVEERELERKKDLQERIDAIIGDARKTELEKAIEAEAEKYDALIKEAEGNTEQILALERAKQDAITKIELDAARDRADKLAALELEIAQATASTAEEQRALEIQATEKYYDDLIAKAIENNLSTVDLVIAKNNAVAEKNAQFRQEDLDAQAAAYEAEAAITQAKLGLALQAANLLSQLAGENKKLQIAAIAIEKAASIGQILVSTGIANAKAVAASPLTFGQPWVAINSISAGLAIASTIAAGAQAIAEINKADTDTDTPAEKTAPAVPSSKFKKGGLLGGRLHKEGGVTSPFGELEGGEFVVNRASTASFLPMLEKINSLGQGQTVDRGNISSQQEINNMGGAQPIIKTYVVASDMTTEQEKQRKLKMLAAL